MPSSPSPFHSVLRNHSQLNSHLPKRRLRYNGLYDWQEYREFVAEFVSEVQAAKKAGKSVDQALAGLKMPEKYRVCDPKLTSTTELRTDADCAYRMDQAKADAEIVYDELGRSGTQLLSVLDQGHFIKIASLRSP